MIEVEAVVAKVEVVVVHVVAIVDGGGIAW